MLYQSSPTTIQAAGDNVVLTYVLEKNEEIVHTFLCLLCRHIWVSPTFDDCELDRLYSEECLTLTKSEYRKAETNSGRSWYAQHGIDVAAANTRQDSARAYRAKRLWEFVDSELNGSNFSRVLDFGGGNGELTRGFQTSKRYVYDKVFKSSSEADVIPITREDGLKSHAPFDLLIMSHVLEHLPSPTEQLKKIYPLLSHTAAAYFEVPLEYCGALIKKKGVPLGAHVNYFTRSSLRECIRRAGFGDVISLKREVAPYGECQMATLKAVATNHRRPKPSRDNRKRLLQVWPVELFFDAACIYKSRNTRFQYDN
jgi:hypothetical protein